MARIIRAPMPLEYAARASSGNSDALRADGTTLDVQLHCTAVSGTDPTLDVEVEYSVDGANWVSAGTAHTFTQLTAAGFEAKQFTIESNTYRVKYTIGGTDTPTFTFGVQVLES